MSDYSSVRVGKLKLKGEKRKKKKQKTPKSDSPEDTQREADVADAQNHGNWFPITRFEQMTGQVTIEMSPYQYVRALDNGLFILGAAHPPGETPDPEEILTSIRPSNSTHIAFKSGYNKYLSIDNKNRLVGRSDAIGSREYFEPVFQDSKLALLGSNSCFLSADEENPELPYIVARSTTAGPNEMIKIRTNIDPDSVRRERAAKEKPEEEKGSLKEAEINYVKKFQSFQDKKLKINSDNTVSLRDAKDSGRLHEVLLDRRAKMKSDKFCK